MKKALRVFAILLLMVAGIVGCVFVALMLVEGSLTPWHWSGDHRALLLGATCVAVFFAVVGIAPLSDGIE